MNDEVSVKLTEYGLKILNESENKYLIDSYYNEKTNILTVPLWELFRIYGSRLSIGFHNVPFIDIIIE